MNAGAEPAVKPFAISNKTVLAIAIPMSLAFLTTPLMGIVDTAVVGQFGVPALIGGLAIGAILIDLLFVTFNFLRYGTVGLTAQAYGANDEKERQAILARALSIAIVAGILLIVLSPLILWAGLHFMAPTDAVAEAASDYFLIRNLGSPFALGNYVILGWLLGCDQSNKGVLIQIVINCFNIGLSLFLGLSLGWGISGVAIATVLAEISGFIFGSVVCWRLLDHQVRPSWGRLTNIGAWKRLVNLNSDIMIRSFSLLFAFAYFTAQGTKFGETTLAANAVLMHFFLVSGFFLDGSAAAAEQLCERAIGANYRAGFWKALKLSTFWNFLLAILLVVVFFLFGDWLIGVMTSSPEVQETAAIYMYWAFALPLIGMLAFQLDGVYMGATWSRDMSIMMVLSLAIYLLAWLLLEERLANHGLWLSLHIFMVARAITLLSRIPANMRKSFPNQEA